MFPPSEPVVFGSGWGDFMVHVVERIVARRFGEGIPSRSGATTRTFRAGPFCAVSRFSRSSGVAAFALFSAMFLLAVGTASAGAAQDAPNGAEAAIDRVLSPFKLAYHRGNTDVGQEESRKAVVAAFESRHPHVEVDVTSFVSNGTEVGLLAHENEMRRSTGVDGVFQDYGDTRRLPANITDPELPPEPFMTMVELFELIKAYKTRNAAIPIVSLDLKVEEHGEPFGRWLGNLIRTYGFESHVFASSFWKGSLDGIRAACPRCLTGGVVFQDHWALRFLDRRYSSLDVADAIKLGFFLGFPDKKRTPHDFVLIHDAIFFDTPEIADFWRNERGVRFVGIFTQGNHGTYSKAQWKLIEEKRIRWLELSPDHIQQGTMISHLRVEK